MPNWPVPWPRGHDLVLVARRRDRLDALAQGLRGHGVRVHAVDCDVTEPGAGVFLAAAVAERALEVSILCNNAGAAYGVAVTALCPGTMPTEFMQHAGLAEALPSMPSFVLDDPTRWPSTGSERSNGTVG